MSKKLLFAFVTALLFGVVGFYYLNLPLLFSLVGTLGVFALFVLIPLPEKKTEHVKVEMKERNEDHSEAYKLLKEKFKAVSDKAEKLEHEKKNTELFLASMSHEIRTPLNGIIGLTEVLDGMELNKEQKEFVSLIRESCNNLRVIVDDILEISKLNSGKMELECIPFDIVTKLEASVGLFTPRFHEKGIVQSVTIDPMIPREVKGDPTRLSQVITNLVSNSIKFTPKGGTIDVIADLVKREDGKVTLKIAVKDSGIGLSKAQQKKIFDAYAQASASTNRTAGGTGLGLTISRKIVHSMGGELSVESEEGNGATFYFTITLQETNKAPVTTEKKSLKEVIAPVKKEVLDNGELATKEVHKAPVKIEEKSPKEVIVPVKKEVLDSGELTVLAAEDNPINQKLIRIVFEKLGMKATLVDNGQKALEARQAEDFDLIFMDVQMPVMDGVEATHAILAYEKEHGLAHVPIIALTANALPGDREKYIKEGMDDYATKPLDVKVIEELRDKYCKKT